MHTQNAWVCSIIFQFKCPGSITFYILLLFFIIIFYRAQNIVGESHANL